MIHCHSCNVTVKDINRHIESVTHYKIKQARKEGYKEGTKEIDNKQWLVDMYKQENTDLIKKVKELSVFSNSSSLSRRHLKPLFDRLFGIVGELTPTINLKDIEIVKQNSKQEVICTICMDKIIRREQMFRTPCSHRFHPFCYLRWCDTKKGTTVLCPNCNEVSNIKYINTELIKAIGGAFETVRS
jgi:hypothetical protein